MSVGAPLGVRHLALAADSSNVGISADTDLL